MNPHLHQSDDGATVITLVPRTDEDANAPIRRRPRRPGFCRHHRLELDQGTERAYCKDCEQEVPLFKALLIFCSEYERWADARNHARAEAKKAQARLDDLKREERNAKARLRRIA